MGKYLIYLAVSGLLILPQILSAEIASLQFAQAETEVEEESDFLFDADSVWDQVPLEIEKKINLSAMEGWGLLVFILYLLTLSFTIYALHMSAISHKLAPEAVILIYIACFLFLPVAVWIVIRGLKLNRT